MNLSRYNIFLPAIVVFWLCVLCGCNAFNRLPLSAFPEELVVLQSIGFLKEYNTHMTKDCLGDIDESLNTINIALPYTTDMTNGLYISFALISDESSIGIITGASDDDFFEWTSGKSLVQSNDIDETLKIRVRTVHPISKEVIYKNYDLYIRKIILPVLLNSTIKPNITNGDVEPLKIRFVDETGAAIPNMEQGKWNNDSNVQLWYESDDISLLQYPPIYNSEENAFILSTQPHVPGAIRIFLPNRIFEDNMGLVLNGEDNHPSDSKEKGTFLIVNYDPPNIYLSYLGNDDNLGLSPEKPVKSWIRAMEQASKTSAQDIHVAASDEHFYDVNGEGDLHYIDNTSPWFNIYGGFRPDFSRRYVDSGFKRGEYPKTVFIDKAQKNGTIFGHSSVFSYDSKNVAPFSPIIDGITIQVAPNLSDIMLSTGLELANTSRDENTTITVRNVECISNQNTQQDNIALLVHEKASVNIKDSWIIGKISGENSEFNTQALSLENFALVTINNSTIIGGDSGGQDSFALEASSGEGLEVIQSRILSGFKGENDEEGSTEKRSIGLRIKDTPILLERVWVHTSGSTEQSIPILFDENSTDTAIGSFILANSTLIAGNSGESAGILFNPDSNGISNVYIYNSVLTVGKSTSEPTTGLHFKQHMRGYLTNNIIHLRTNDADDMAIAIRIAMGTPTRDIGLDIRNNLIYSNDTNNLKGMHSIVNITRNDFHDMRFQFRHNNIWDTDDKIQLMWDGVNEIEIDETYEMYSPHAIVNTNIKNPNIDMSYSYTNNDFSLGRISGEIPLEISIGGEALNNLTIEENLFRTDLNKETNEKDKDGNTRTGGRSIGWSMGAYEDDTGVLPNVFHVSEEGTDDNILGSEMTPFKTLDRAYEVAYGGLHDNQNLKIQVHGGTYKTQNLEIEDGEDLIILGGLYGETTTLYSESEYVIAFKGDDAANPVQLQGFTIISQATGEKGTGIYIGNQSHAIIRNNIISGGNNESSYGIYIENASPTIEKNAISAGLGQKTYGIYAETESTDNLLIAKNSISGGTGTSSAGLHISGNAKKTISQNSIYGGSVQTGNTVIGQEKNYGIYLNGSENILINNLIHGGMHKKEVLGIEVNGSSNTISNNTIYGGISEASSSTILISSGSDNALINNLIIPPNTPPPSAPSYSISIASHEGINTSTFLNNFFTSLLNVNVKLAQLPNSNIDFSENADSELDDWLADGIMGEKSTIPGQIEGTYVSEEDAVTYLQKFTRNSYIDDFLIDNWDLKEGMEGLPEKYGVTQETYTIDMNGTTRTVPWSVGAHERD